MNGTFKEPLMLIDEVIMKTFYYIKKKLFLYGDDTVVELVNITEEKVEKQGNKYLVTPLILASTLREIPVSYFTRKIVLDLEQNGLIENKEYINKIEVKRIVDLYKETQEDEVLFGLIKPYIK